MPITVTPKEAREARSFLQRRGLTSRDVPPRDFAKLAKRLNASFTSVLKLVASLKMKGQGEGPFARTTQALERIEK